MQWFAEHQLSFLVFLPLALALISLAVPESFVRQGVSKAFALASTLLIAGLSVRLYAQFEPLNAAFQWRELVSWIPAMGVHYEVGADGVSIFLILLTTLLMPVVVLGAFNAVESREREFYALLLALESAMLGAFVALDVFLFYVFWEAMLIPMYFLVGIWGGKDRIYAAMKLFLYTLVGSLLMLVAIFYLAHEHLVQFGVLSTRFGDLTNLKLPSSGFFGPQELLFLAFAIAFAIKVPLFPLHTWLPDAHVQAPTSGSVILAAILLKMGGYGLIRFAFPLFPEAAVQYQSVFLVLGTVAIVYGALVALVQPDIKKLVAYSSVSHMGYVVIGLFAFNSTATSGAYYQMLNHGVSTGALFLLVGMIYERRHTREIADFGGLTQVMPWFAAAFLIVTLSSVALPGTNGFVGEFLILLGTWKAAPVMAVIAATGVILGAVYMLWMFQRVMFGKIVHSENSQLKDLSARESLVLGPLIAAVFLMGLFPNWVFVGLTPSLERSFARIRTIQTAQQLAGNRVEGAKNVANLQLAAQVSIKADRGVQ